jgi:hypothetical protein
MCAHLVHGVVVVVRELPIESQSTPPFMCCVCTFGACMMSRIMYCIRSLGGYKEILYSIVCSWGGYIYTIDIHTLHTYIYMYKDCAIGELSWMFGKIVEFFDTINIVSLHQRQERTLTPCE